MPKIIDSAREQLLQAARQQVTEHGYAKTTIRSVAGACRMAVGTVYNYFPSKDMLIASYMAEDWQACMTAMRASGGGSAKERLYTMHRLLRTFMDEHQALFADAEAAKVYGTALAQRHNQLRGQLAAMLEPYCPNDENKAYTASFVAEALLTWTQEGTPFEQMYAILAKLM